MRGDFVDPDLVKMMDIPEEEAERRGSGPESGIEEDLGTVSGPTTTRQGELEGGGNRFKERMWNNYVLLEPF